jgi:hypothetical protein
LPVLPSGSAEKKTSLFLLDVFAGHTTDAVLSKLRSAGVLTSLIPGGYTGLLQPLDTAVNKPFKNYLRDFTDQYIDEAQEKRGCDIDQWSVSDKSLPQTSLPPPPGPPLSPAVRLDPQTRSQSPSPPRVDRKCPVPTCQYSVKLGSLNVKENLIRHVRKMRIEEKRAPNAPHRLMSRILGRGTCGRVAIYHFQYGPQRYTVEFNICDDYSRLESAHQHRLFRFPQP